MTHPVLSKLNEFNAALVAAKNSPDHNTSGRDKLAADIVALRDAYRPAAVQALAADWQALRTQHAATQARLDKAKEQAESSWDFARLAYASKAVESQLAAISAQSNLLSGATQLQRVEAAYQAGLGADKTTARAWAEIAPGYVQARFGSEDGAAANTLTDRMAADLAQLLDTPALQAARAQAEADAAAADELLAVTAAAKAAYNDPNTAWLTPPDKFDAMAAGVRVVHNSWTRPVALEIEPPAKEPAAA